MFCIDAHTFTLLLLVSEETSFSSSPSNLARNQQNKGCRRVSWSGKFHFSLFVGTPSERDAQALRGLTVAPADLTPVSLSLSLPDHVHFWGGGAQNSVLVLRGPTVYFPASTTFIQP